MEGRKAGGRRTCAEQLLSRLLGFCAGILPGFSSVTSGTRCCSCERDERRSVEGRHGDQDELSSRGRAAAGGQGRRGEREKGEERGCARADSRAGSSVRHQISDPRSRKNVGGVSPGDANLLPFARRSMRVQDRQRAAEQMTRRDCEATRAERPRSSPSLLLRVTD